MRERKYRLFTNVDRVMVHHEDLMKMPAKDWIAHPNLTEYTGLKDKNGVEIWEGDIIKHEGGGPSFVVRWNQEAWDEDGFHTGFHLPFTGDQYEVLGNVHEHPHLLKESQ